MATALEVILTEDQVAGKAGELVKVKPGYARNFLLPRGLAVVADAYQMDKFAERKAELEKIAEEKRQNAESQKEQLGDEASVTVEAKAGETGKLFGAITKEKIATAVTEQLNIPVTKANVKGAIAIKTTGEHPISLDLGSGIEAAIKVKVVSE